MILGVPWAYFDHTLSRELLIICIQARLITISYKC